MFIMLPGKEMQANISDEHKYKIFKKILKPKVNSTLKE